jgi:hypothetical protein
MEKEVTTRRNIFTSKVEVKLKKKPVKCCILSIVLCGAETWALQKLDQKYLGSFEMWCWRRMEINWTDSVGDEEV